MVTCMTVHDDLDIALIGLLKENARRSNTEIASALGISETAVRKRLSKLMERGHLRIVPWLNPPQLGMTTVIITLSVELQRLAAVAQQLAELPEVFYCGVLTGPFDIIVHTMFWSEKDLYEFLRHKLAPIEGIRSSQTSIILEIVKFDYSPEVLRRPQLPPSRRRRVGSGKQSQKEY